MSGSLESRLKGLLDSLGSSKLIATISISRDGVRILSVQNQRALRQLEEGDDDESDDEMVRFKRINTKLRPENYMG